MNTNMQQIEESAHNVQIPLTQKRLIEDSCLEITFKNSEKGGKYIRLSNELVSTLGITNSVDILPIRDKGVIMMAAKLSFPAACTVTLNKDDYNDIDGNVKVAYNSALVDLLIKEVYLEFYGRDRVTYSTITIGELTNGTVAALLHLYYVDDDEDVDEDED